MMMTKVKKVMEAVVKMRKMMKVMLAYVDDDKGEDKEEYDGDDDDNNYYECDEDEDDYCELITIKMVLASLMVKIMIYK